MSFEPVLAVRPAVVDDLAAITALTRDRRHELAAWEPWYWNPRKAIDETHPLYLGWCIEHNPNCDVHVADENGSVVGCVFVNRRPDHDFLDDLCVVDERWQEIGGALIESCAAGTQLICAPAKDIAQHRWLQSSKFSWASTFFSLRTPDKHSSETAGESVPLPTELAQPPAHVFGHFDASTDNGLRVSTADGYAIGSAPALPAAYDPGGPTTVIDRVGGPNRRNVVDAALHAASRRGDVHVIVVVDHIDQELTRILHEAGATRPVNLWRTPSAGLHEPPNGRLAS